MSTGDVRGRRGLVRLDAGRGWGLRSADTAAPEFAAVVGDGADKCALRTPFLFVDVGASRTWNSGRDLGGLAARHLLDGPLHGSRRQRITCANLDASLGGRSFGVGGEGNRRKGLSSLDGYLVTLPGERDNAAGRSAPAHVVTHLSVVPNRTEGVGFAHQHGGLGRNDGDGRVLGWRGASAQGKEYEDQSAADFLHELAVPRPTFSRLRLRKRARKVTLEPAALPGGPSLVLDTYSYFCKYRIMISSTTISSTTKKSAERVAKYADMFSAMGTEARLRIMQLLLSAHPDGLVVGEIQEELEIPNSTLSHHLDKLKAEGLVQVQRESTFLRYTASTDALEELLRFLYAECCTRNKAVKPEQIVQICR
jgi:ArsR family transcriptional regulator, arsenate/arsenite/antimonite-responsive transcriptional repressor